MFAEECCLGEVDIHVRIIFSIPRPRIINAVEIFSTQKLTNKHLNSDFNDDIGKEIVEGYKEALPGEKEFWFKSASQFARTPGFHKDGIVLSVSSSTLSLSIDPI
jgi:hypothetical protein